MNNGLVERLYPVADLVIPIPETADVNVNNLVKLSEFEKQVKTAQASIAGATPISSWKADGAVARANTQEGELIKLLTTCVDPESWSGKGGRATIAYHSGCMTLAVHATPAHQERIATVLAGLRRRRAECQCSAK
jgi:hypothetical protein